MPDRTEITSPDELRDLLGEVMPRAAAKERPVLHRRDREWLAASPFCLIGTSDADGRCDVSPKGDPAGRLAHVLDDRTIAIAERPGNRRADGYFNVLSNPYAGLVFFIPGRNETLRINGRARLLRDAPYFDDLVVKGHRPLLALEIDIETIYHHCAKAFLRSQLWKPETWNPDALPSHARITKEVMVTPESVEELEAYYGESYAERLYKS